MSVYLNIIPVHPNSFRGELLLEINTRLRFTQDYRILGQLTDLSEHAECKGLTVLPSYPLPPGVVVEMIFNERATTTNLDDFGDSLTYMTAAAMKYLVLPEDSYVSDRAIMAYINTLPGDWAIVLVWN